MKTHHYFSCSVPIFLMASCASVENRPITAVEAVERNHAAVNTTNAYLTETEKELNDFEVRLKNLRGSAKDSPAMRGKQDFTQTLNELETRTRQARVHLSHLQRANAENWVNFRARLDEDLADMRKAYLTSIPE